VEILLLSSHASSEESATYHQSPRVLSLQCSAIPAGSSKDERNGGYITASNIDTKKDGV